MPHFNISTETQTVLMVNQALASQDPELLMKSLQNPVVQLASVHPAAGQLYLEELASMRTEKGQNLEFEEIDAALQGEKLFGRKNEQEKLITESFAWPI